jgi:hypothetical protein
MNEFTCKHCGDKFTPSKETISLYEEGFIDIPDTCNFCIQYGSGEDCNDYSEYSDADPGL